MKTSIFFTLIFIFSTMLPAQNKGTKGLVVGFSVGPSYANFTNQKAPHALYAPLPVLQEASYQDNKNVPEVKLIKDARPGFSAGGSVEYFLGKGWSVASGLFYETKGRAYNTATSWDSIISTPDADYRYWGNKSYLAHLKNDYLCIPVTVRKYLFRNGSFFVELGAYAGWLHSSRYKTKLEYNYNSPSSSSMGSSISNWKDSKKEFTNQLDFGFTCGIGYSTSIAPRWILQAGILTNLGFAKVDAKHHNEYSEQPIPTSSGYKILVQSANYYGLNSYAKNINMSLRIGLAYRLGL